VKAPMPTVVVMKSVCERHFRPGGGLSLSRPRDLSIVIVMLDLHGVVLWSRTNSFLSSSRWIVFTVHCGKTKILLKLLQKCRHNTSQ
jgi:hypothetical protein